MTTKIQTMAMFAVAAFALVGLGASPAFATTDPYEWSDIALAGNTETTSSGALTNLCGGGGTGSYEMKLSESNPGSEDSLKATWNLTCGVSFEDIDVSIYKKSGTTWNQWGSTQNSSSQSGNVIFAPSIAGGDEWKVKFVINY